MQSSASSSSPTKSIKNGSLKLTLLVWTFRIVLGTVLIFAGLSKAIDPWGGLYKMSDYFGAWGINPSHEILLVLACALASFEFLLGVFTLTGIYRKAVKWLAPAFMTVMTILSLYIWIFDPVSDCGCFGDALIISNSTTFFKNIILLAVSVVIWKFNTQIRGLYTPIIQWLALISSLAYISVIQIAGYHIQPLIDFRPYPVGTNLYIAASEGEGSEDFIFVYEKNGEQKEFSIDNLPDSSWNFVDRKSPANHSDYKFNLSILDEDGEDVTADIIRDSGEQYILLVSDPKRYGIARSEMANRIAEYSKKASANDFFAIVALPPDSLNEWKTETGAEYDVYSAEDTDIKILARGYAALVYLRDGVITWKRNMFAIPPEFPEGEVSAASIADEDNRLPFRRITLVWAIVMVVILVFSRFAIHFSRISKQRQKASSHNKTEKEVEKAEEPTHSESTDSENKI